MDAVRRKLLSLLRVSQKLNLNNDYMLDNSVFVLSAVILKSCLRKKIQKRPGNSIISGAWPNQTYYPGLTYWLSFRIHKLSANRRVGLVWPCTRNYTIAKPLSLNRTMELWKIAPIFSTTKGPGLAKIDLIDRGLPPKLTKKRWVHYGSIFSSKRYINTIWPPVKCQGLVFNKSSKMSFNK